MKLVHSKCKKGFLLPLLFFVICCSCSKSIQYGLNGVYTLQKNQKLISLDKVGELSYVVEENRKISANCYVSKIIVNRETESKMMFSFCSLGVDEQVLKSTLKNCQIVQQNWTNPKLNDSVLVYRVIGDHDKYIFREFGFPHAIIIDFIGNDPVNANPFEFLENFDVKYIPN
jgi:hypothetical protein